MNANTHINKLSQKDLISRETYRRIKQYNREQLSGYIKNLNTKAMQDGYALGKTAAEKNEKIRQKQIKSVKDSSRENYQPFTCWGSIHDTGTQLDGHTYLLTLWDWDNYAEYHLGGAGEKDHEAERALMLAMHDADDEYKDMPIDEFEKLWKDGEYTPPGIYAIALENATIKSIVCMERESVEVPEETDETDTKEEEGEPNE